MGGLLSNVSRLRNLPILGGTEMNAFGQKFIDDFDSQELKPLLGNFLTGAYIMYAHAALQRCSAMGYTSKWATEQFSDIKGKNDFFETVGKNIEPIQESKLEKCDMNCTPADILDIIKAS